MITLSNELSDVKSVGIAGHVRPDGDCTGACLGLKNYIDENFPDTETTVYLDMVIPGCAFLRGSEGVQTESGEDKIYDLFISLDVSSPDRLGRAGKYFSSAKRTLCIDHHVTNSGFADKNWIVGEASSTSELIFEMLDEDRISKAVAEALYLGIVHDTGVFQYTNTTERTMQIAGRLMSKGIDFNRIIEESFYRKTYVQNQVLGRTLVESILMLDGKVIVGRILKKDMDFYGVGSADLEGIVNQLRLTEGVEVAVFISETGNQTFKVSLRSNSDVDVSAICSYFGGGGHVKAAGCTMHGNFYDVVNNLTLHIEKQLTGES